MQPSKHLRQKTALYPANIANLVRTRVSRAANLRAGHMDTIELPTIPIGGQDHRTLEPQTTVAPFAAIAMLDCNSGASVGTGWFISPTILVTAAHVIFDSGLNPLPDVTVAPGRNGSSVPLGEFPVVKQALAPGWDGTFESALDYAAIQVSRPSNIWFSVAAMADQQLSGLPVNLVGYPTDDPLNIGIQPGTMWVANGELGTAGGGAIASDLLTYAIDTSQGQSGSPIFTVGADGTALSVGLHLGDDLFGVLNQGLRLNGSVLAVFSKWIDQGLS